MSVYHMTTLIMVQKKVKKKVEKPSKTPAPGVLVISFSLKSKFDSTFLGCKRKKKQHKKKGKNTSP